jgi:hypothetical protein
MLMSVSYTGIIPFAFLTKGRLPKNLSLNQTSNYKTFTVNWSMGSANGGANGCKIQFLKVNSVWTDLILVNCDLAGSSAGAISLPNDGWNGSAWSSVAVRLIRASDSFVIGSLGNLQCTVISASASSTPNVDEDCNNNWNNSSSVCGTCTKWSFNGTANRYQTLNCSGSPYTNWPSNPDYYGVPNTYDTSSSCETSRSSFASNSCEIRDEYGDNAHLYSQNYVPISSCISSSYTDCIICGSSSIYN